MGIPFPTRNRQSLPFPQFLVVVMTFLAPPPNFPPAWWSDIQFIGGYSTGKANQTGEQWLVACEQTGHYLDSEHSPPDELWHYSGGGRWWWRGVAHSQAGLPSLTDRQTDIPLVVGGDRVEAPRVNPRQAFPGGFPALGIWCDPQAGWHTPACFPPGPPIIPPQAFQALLGRRGLLSGSVARHAATFPRQDRTPHTRPTLPQTLTVALNKNPGWTGGCSQQT